MPESELAIPGVVYVGPKGRVSGTEPFHHVVQIGAAAGWMKPRGIREWEREVSVIQRDALTEALRNELGATLPEEQIPSAKLPLTSRAAKESPLIAVQQALVEKLVERGVRVHTIGFDKISGGFYYFAEGAGEAVRVQGDLIEMISPALDGGDNSDLESCLDGVIDRILVDLSKGTLNEAAVELAEALPRLATDGRGASECDLDAFEASAAELSANASKYEVQVRALIDKLAAKSSGAIGEVVPVPLYGEAQRDSQPSMLVDIGGKQMTLKQRDRWFVSGVVKEEEPVKAAPVPEAKPAAATATNGKTPTPATAAVAAKPQPAAEAKTAVESKPVEAKAEAKPAETKPVETKAAAAKPVETKAATPSKPPGEPRSVPRPAARTSDPPKVAPATEAKEPEVKAKEPEAKAKEPEAAKVDSATKNETTKAKEPKAKGPDDTKKKSSKSKSGASKAETRKVTPVAEDSEPRISTEPSARRAREMAQAKAQSGGSTKFIVGFVVLLLVAFLIWKMTQS